MALTATLETMFGEERDLYVRLNNFEQLANHGVPAIARFRGFASKEAFEQGKAFMWEGLVEFAADAPDKAWALAYDALKTFDFAGADRAGLSGMDARIAEIDDRIAAASVKIAALEGVTRPEVVEEAEAAKRLVMALEVDRKAAAQERAALVAKVESSAAVSAAFAKAATA